MGHESRSMSDPSILYYYMLIIKSFEFRILQYASCIIPAFRVEDSSTITFSCVKGREWLE